MIVCFLVLHVDKRPHCFLVLLFAEGDLSVWCVCVWYGGGQECVLSRFLLVLI
jgi:hypothetical protein